MFLFIFTEEKNKFGNISKFIFTMTDNQKTLPQNYELLQATVKMLNQDYEKFKEKKVKVAGSRFRNNLLNCKKLCDVIRKQVQTEIQKLPVKSRAKSAEAQPPQALTPETTPEADTEPDPEEPKKRKPRKANKPKTDLS